MTLTKDLVILDQTYSYFSQGYKPKQLRSIRNELILSELHNRRLTFQDQDYESHDPIDQEQETIQYPKQHFSRRILILSTSQSVFNTTNLTQLIITIIKIPSLFHLTQPLHFEFLSGSKVKIIFWSSEFSHSLNFWYQILRRGSLQYSLCGVVFSEYKLIN